MSLGGKKIKKTQQFPLCLLMFGNEKKNHFVVPLSPDLHILILRKHSSAVQVRWGHSREQVVARSAENDRVATR